MMVNKGLHSAYGILPFGTNCQIFPKFFKFLGVFIWGSNPFTIGKHIRLSHYVFYNIDI